MEELREVALWRPTTGSSVYERTIWPSIVLHHERSSLRWREGGQKSPVEGGKRGTKRSVAVDGRLCGIPLGTIVAPAKTATTHRPLLAPRR
jgi:hypothetical protein